MHESTVSRVTSNKYIFTPQGIFELKFFFHKGVNSFMGQETMSSVNVKQLLKEIVAGEDVEHPFSDSTLTYRLQIKNINIARRTVTKYRKELSIPPASKRRKRF
jgi:RNA polymerase sigma-54 factor